MKYLVKKKYRFDAEFEVDAATPEEARAIVEKTCSVRASVARKPGSGIIARMMKTPRKDNVIQVRRISSGLDDIPKASRGRAYSEWLSSEGDTRFGNARLAALKAASDAMAMFGGKITRKWEDGAAEPYSELVLKGKDLIEYMKNRGAVEAVNSWRNNGTSMLGNTDIPIDISPFIEIIDEALRDSAEGKGMDNRQYMDRIMKAYEKQSGIEASEAVSYRTFERLCREKGASFDTNGRAYKEGE